MRYLDAVIALREKRAKRDSGSPPAEGARARSAVSADPRPDIAEDSDLWNQLLASAWADAEAPTGLYGSLLGLRCVGSRLVHEGGRWLIVPRAADEGEPQPDVDARLVRDKCRFLLPHKDRLTVLLSRLPRPGAAP